MRGKTYKLQLIKHIIFLNLAFLKVRHSTLSYEIFQFQLEMFRCKVGQLRIDKMS